MVKIILLGGTLEIPSSRLILKMVQMRLRTVEAIYPYGLVAVYLLASSLVFFSPKPMVFLINIRVTVFSISGVMGISET